MAADLHVHTNASDGRLSPQTVIDLALRANLSYVAITDHDTVAGLQTLRQAGQDQQSTLTIIPGIEFSTDMPQREVHILAYYIDIDHPELQRQLAILKASRLERARKMIAKVIELGYAIDFGQVQSIAGQASTLGRPHIARALVEKNYFSSVATVFDLLLDKDMPAYIPHYKLSPNNIIHLIEQAGGISVLAHPGLIDDESTVHAMIQAGIRGLEVYHPKHDERQVENYLCMAKKYNLAVTGGSDFHANPGRFPETLGLFTVPDKLVLNLQHLLDNT
jgi:3',5'-nucleoside bisphosphate phosphatase